MAFYSHQNKKKKKKEVPTLILEDKALRMVIQMEV